MNNNDWIEWISGFEKLFAKTTGSKYILESNMHIENGNGDLSWSKGFGGRTIDSPMVLASVSKLFTTTCILNLREQGKIFFEDNLSKYFSSEVLQGLHIYKGRDCSNDLTVKNLLFQTTGFPDVFVAGKDSIEKAMFKGDVSFKFEDYIRITKENKKMFAPSTPNKAHYSDLNFEMLGKIIEKVEGSSLHNAYKKYIFNPLDMQNTYLPEDDSDFIPPMYYKDKIINRPNLILSLPASGGCISTSKDVMKFLKAFFCGELFNKEVFKDLRKFAGIQYAPGLAQYGGGFVRMNIAGIASLYRLKGELIGHMGGTGTYAFYYPDKDLYFVGDVNNLEMVAMSKVFTVPLKLAKIVSNL